MKKHTERGITVKIKVKELNPGDRFGYGMKSAIVLDKMDDGVLCMVVDENYQCEFDKDNNNNFTASTLRRNLDSDYAQQWIDEGANPRDFVEMEVDLTADDGLDDYGTCKCYFAPRTCDQHRKYRKLIPNCDDWEWTATSWSAKSNGDSCAVRSVYTDGSLNDGIASVMSLVRPLFKLKPDTEVEVEISKYKCNSDNRGSLDESIKSLINQYGTADFIETFIKILVEECNKKKEKQS